MIQSSSPVLTHDFPSPPTTSSTTTGTSTTLKSPPSLNSTTTDEVVDILSSRKLLRPVSNDSSLQALTPRKRALARKTSNLNSIANNDLFSPPSAGSLDLTRSPKISTVENDIDIGDDPEARTTLFQFHKAKILSFEELSETMEDPDKSQGRLLGHGRFEVYQLHQKRVSYFQCGSVVYPILPRLKVLKISFNQFIIPLSNPERYWRIVLETDDSGKIKELETALKTICHFRNLYANNESKPKPAPPSSLITSHEISPIKIDQHDNRSNTSLASITTAVACFALESDTSTYVEDLNHPIPLSPKKRHRSDSNTSSLDLELDGFFQETEQTQYYTAYPLFFDSTSTPTNETHDTIIISPNSNRNSSSFFNNNSAILSVPKTRPRSSRSTTLYHSETSWMDPEDIPINSSTPNTQRYVSLNLNPNASFGNLRNKSKEKRILTDPLFNLKTTRPKADSSLRFSSYDVYNMLRDEDVESQKKDAGFKGFIQSFFA